ncbi:uncharacterized protein LOC117781061 [Drosophila innubila]|uniref:uncharacterized protein LOC117781061 n=1 Tax=Drosophila innubila TaxID=198719 RepID=UPI00148B79AD|nr:uncharacterized protein LOC117781061 [Drosophila innubila]
MNEEFVIIKEEIDIDDTKIKLELDDGEDASDLEMSCAGGLMKIIEERPNMITVPVHDYKSEDELKFIASLSTLDQQQKLFVTSAPALNEYECKICNFMCENHLALASHQINHQLNHHFCSHGCGRWCNTLEEILEHEYRQHESGGNSYNCRICLLRFPDSVSLARHITGHIYVRRFVCAICRRHFESRQGLQLHRQHSKEPCGRIDYVDTLGNVGQLVAITQPYGPLPAEMLCDVEIKSEPLDAEEEDMEQQPELADVVIKTEPKEELEVLSPSTDIIWPSVSATSLPEQLRGKLRLPAIKKPLKTESLAKVEAAIHATPKIQFVPVNRWQSLPTSVCVVPTKRPNILKSVKDKNQQQATNILKKENILQAVKSSPNVASNILKVLPSNCMVFKLPLNTKIIKIPTTSTAPTMTNANTNSCTIGSNGITYSNAMTISAGPTATVSASTASPAAGSLRTHVARNSYFSDLSLFETLPESRKIIADFQSQIRSIEQSLPLPGSVLQTPKKSSNGVLPTQLEVLKLPLTKLSSDKVREMRYKYPDHRFHWECPKCARCYEQHSAFYNHLTFAHSIPKEEFVHMQVEVKTYKKVNPIASRVTDSDLLSPNVDAPVSPKTVVPSPVTPALLASEAEASDVPALKHAVPAIKITTSAVSASPVDETPVKPAKGPVKPESNGATKSPQSKDGTRLAQYQCEDCSKCFTTIGARRIHMLIHTGELPHKCNYCDKRFRTPGQVRVHQRRHTGEKPFKCKVCSLDFTHRETLISHLSRHIGMKRYKCYGCDKNFVVVSGLRAHRRLRPDTCGKVKFTARAHGPRVRVIRGEVIFESHPEHNGYLRSEDPLNILSEISQVDKDLAVPDDAVS